MEAGSIIAVTAFTSCSHSVFTGSHDIVPGSENFQGGRGNGRGERGAVAHGNQAPGGKAKKQRRAGSNGEKNHIAQAQEVG